MTSHDGPGRRRVYRHAALDSTLWDDYRPREGDIVISTSIKAGTTWMQAIVASLLWPAGDPPGPVNELSPWFERIMSTAAADLERQEHRRFIKTHLPADGLPLHPQVRYIAVARDGRDVFMSLIHHWATMRPAAFEMSNALAELNGIDPLPPYHGDIHRAFDDWISRGSFPWEGDGWPWWSHLANVASWWALRTEPNVLLVHYDDLKADLAGEMRRVAAFIDADVPDDAWPEVVERCTLTRMRARAEEVVPERFVFEEDGARFFNKGTSGQWRGALTEAELARYDARVAQVLEPEAAAWLADGRLAGGASATG